MDSPDVYTRDYRMYRSLDCVDNFGFLIQFLILTPICAFIEIDVIQYIPRIAFELITLGRRARQFDETALKNSMIKYAECSARTFIYTPCRECLNQLWHSQRVL